MADEIPEAAVLAATDLSYGGKQLTRLHAKAVLDYAVPHLRAEQDTKRASLVQQISDLRGVITRQAGELAERDTEITGLRKQVEQLAGGLGSCEYLLPYGHEDAQTCDQPCHPTTDRCPQHDQRHLDYIASLTGEIAALRAENEKAGELWHEVVDSPKDGSEAQIWLRRWMTSGSSIADDPAEYGDVWFVRADEVHEVIHAYLVANGLPTYEAPSTPQEGQT